VSAASHPHSVENGVGDRITFLGLRSDADGRELLELENRLGPGSGPPMHVHHLQEEALTVREGRLGYQLADGPERFAGPGETITFAAGQAHRFWNTGEEDLVCSGWVTPPHNVEYFLTELYASARRAGGARPGALDSAYLLGRYRSEFAICDVPAPVRLVAFPLMRIAGRLLGRRQRFAGAPEPVRG
jgi:quercetin dioxygenase-like cupin family protein